MTLVLDLEDEMGRQQKSIKDHSGIYKSDMADSN